MKYARGIEGEVEGLAVLRIMLQKLGGWAGRVIPIRRRVGTIETDLRGVYAHGGGF